MSIKYWNVFLADLSILFFLSTQESSNIASKQSRKHTILITWNHTHSSHNLKSEYKKKNQIFYCKYCKNSLYKCQNNLSFQNHFLKKHDINIQSESCQIQVFSLLKLQNLYNKTAHSSQIQEFDVQILKKMLNKKIINEILILLVVVWSLFFCLIEWLKFHVFCKAFNFQIDCEIISSHFILSKKIQILWLTHKDIVWKKLQSALSRIHFFLDIWISSNKILFLEICSHFVEYEKEKLFKTFLKFHSVMSHSVNSQFDALLPVFQDYEIIWNLESIINNNHSANDKFCCMISTFLLEKKKICWNLIHYQICCFEHIINLAVQSFLFSDLIKDSDEDSDEEEKKAKQTCKKTY